MSDITFSKALRQARKVYLVASYAGGSFDLQITKVQARELFRQLRPAHGYDGSESKSDWDFDSGVLTINTSS